MKKILAFALALAMILTCSLALADRLDDIKAAGKLTVATSPDWPPYEYIDDNGDIVGTDILMCQWMAEQLGVGLEIQPMAFDACLAAVGNGSVDMMVAGMTYDEERLNRMELTGLLEALRQLKEPCDIDLYSDSQYVINGLEKGWAKGWRKRGWKKADKSPALNPDLWAPLLEESEKHVIHYHWLKGHAGHPENERCDRLAVEQSKKYGGKQA